MRVLGLAFQSAWARRFTLSVTVLAIALASCLLLLMERVRHDTRLSFMESVSGVDLVVGPRSGAVALVLQSVFHVGSVPHAMSWQAHESLSQHPAVAWTVPLLLGDSLRGFPVVGTSPSYIEHVRHGDQQPIALAQGRAFAAPFEAVLGHEVARRLRLQLGQAISLTHGLDETHGVAHDDKPMTVVGILAPTGTPLDRTVLVSLASITAMHLDWMGGAPLPGMHIPLEHVRKFNLQPKELNAVLVGLHRRADVFKLQRQINERPGEALQAVMPGVALDELWDMLAQFERSLQAMAWVVTAVGLAGLMATLLAGLNERRRELAVLRALGATPLSLMGLVMLEGVWVTLLGLGVGLLLMQVALWLLSPWALAEMGIRLHMDWPSQGEWQLMGMVLLTGLVFSVLPGLRAWTMSLADGLMPRS